MPGNVMNRSFFSMLSEAVSAIASTLQAKSMAALVHLVDADGIVLVEERKQSKGREWLMGVRLPRRTCSKDAISFSIQIYESLHKHKFQ